VSIIIPTYNRAHLIENTVKSALEVEYENIEVIVVDDGSTDGTGEIVKKMSDTRIKYVKHEKQMGAPKTKADGIRYSVGEYILFGEDDVIFNADYLHKLMNCMNRNNADIVAGRIIYIKENENKKDAVERLNNINNQLLDMKLIKGNFGVKVNKDVEVPFVHALFLTKKKNFDYFSYDENYRGNGYREETDPQISALQQGFKIIFCHDAVCYHLPRIQINGGGQHHMNKFLYMYWTVANNNYFLEKYYPFLKKKYCLKYSKRYMKISFACHTITIGFLSIVYQEYKRIFKKHGIKCITEIQ
jgi:glycosyltransferase involved in cell wall biosynthesis